MATYRTSRLLYSGPDFALIPDQIRVLRPRAQVALWPETDCYTCGKIYDTRYHVKCPYCGNWRSMSAM